MATAEKRSLSQAMRAAISSACIFPGAGLFLLGHYLRGCVFAVPAAVIVLLLFWDIWTTVKSISTQLRQQAELGNSSVDVIALYHQLHGSIFASPYWQDGKWILLASWLISILSSYFVGKRHDLRADAKPGRLD